MSQGRYCGGVVRCHCWQSLSWIRPIGMSAPIRLQYSPFDDTEPGAKRDPDRVLGHGEHHCAKGGPDGDRHRVRVTALESGPLTMAVVYGWVYEYRVDIVLFGAGACHAGFSQHSGLLGV